MPSAASTTFSGMVKDAFGGATSVLIAPYVDQVVSGIVNDTYLGDSEAGQSLANILSSGLVMGLTSAVGGGDAAAYAGAEFQYNYLYHAEQLRREKSKLLLQKCETAAVCSTAEVEQLKSEVAGLDALDAQRDANVKNTCDAAPASTACLGAIQDALAAVEYLRVPRDPLIFPTDALPEDQQHSASQKTRRSSASGLPRS